MLQLNLFDQYCCHCRAHCQVHSWCLKFQPPPTVLEKLTRPWNGTSCALHEFGEDPLLDLALASQADVMVGLHASALLNAFYMPKGSSVVEVRPYQYVGVEPNMYMKVRRDVYR